MELGRNATYFLIVLGHGNAFHQEFSKITHSDSPAFEFWALQIFVAHLKQMQ